MALDRTRMTPFAGVSPSRGTYPIAANVRIFKGALVCLDSAGRAIPGTTKAGGAVTCVGKASAEYDNRTGSELGGSAGAVDVEVEFGVFGYANSADADEIAADDVGKVAFVVDDQTLAATSNSSARVEAGVITELRDGKVWCFMGPHVAPFAEASVLADAGVSLQKRTVTVGHADLTDADTSQTINIGAALPANARILGVSIQGVVTFAGGSATDLVVDIGDANDVDCLIDGADVFGTIVDGQAVARPLGINPNKHYATATQLIATFVSTGDNLVNLTAGTCTIDVLFAVLA